MSKIALSKLIDIVADGNAKTFGNEVLKREYQSFEISANLIYKAVKDQIATVIGDSNLKLDIIKSNSAVSKAYAEIKAILTEKIPLATTEAMNSPKGIDYIDTGKSIIIRAYGSGNNYDKIYNQVFKPGMAKTRPIFDRVLNEVLAINNRAITYAGSNKKPNESPFVLGHAREGSNIKYLLANKFKEVLSSPEFSPTEMTSVLQDIRMTWNSLSLGTTSSEDIVEFLISAASSFSGSTVGDGSKRLVVAMEVQSAAENAKFGAVEEAALRKEFERSLRKTLASRTADEWAEQESSDSQVRRITKVLMQAAAKEGFKTNNKELLKSVDVKQNKAVRKDKTKIKNVGKRAVGTVKVTGTKSQRPQATPSYLALVELINAKLPPKVRSNMGAPRLENQTGRLSESARVTQITQTPAGFPSIEYTYQRSPYDVFDKTLGKAPWNTPGRDPSELVALSVRQLATELGMRRFYTRRAP